MRKPLIALVVVIVLAALGGGIYYATKNKNNNSHPTHPSTTTQSTNTSSASNTPKLQGNAEVQAVLDKVKANVSTVSATRIYTEATDPNNELGKQGQYQYAGAFYDTAANPPDAVTSNYSTSDGGTIEVYANNADAAARGNYLSQFQSGAVQAGAYKVVGNVVLRVSENYTASQQKQLLAMMQSAL